MSESGDPDLKELFVGEEDVILFAPANSSSDHAPVLGMVLLPLELIVLELLPLPLRGFVFRVSFQSYPAVLGVGVPTACKLVVSVSVPGVAAVLQVSGGPSDDPLSRSSIFGGEEERGERLVGEEEGM